MRKWLFLLVGALLFNQVCARAEAQIYYTNKGDWYYHSDPDCDLPPDAEAFYPRECDQKYEISEEAACAFEKLACPLCVKRFKPVYLGEHMPAWDSTDLPWSLAPEVDWQQRRALLDARPEDYAREVADTAARFDAYFEEVWDAETGEPARLHPYPAYYGGRWANAAGGTTYALVDPDAQMLSAFEAMFGGGAWIVPAKYGYEALREDCERAFAALTDWCAAHPELDARPVSAGVDEAHNCAIIGIDGEDGQRAAEAMEDIAPVYVHFRREDMATLATGS